MDFFAACPEMRDSARRVLPVLHGRAGRRVTGCPGRNRLLEDFRIRPSFGGLLRSRDGKSPEPFRQEKQPRPRSFRPGPLREFFSLPGENTEKACQRRASSVDASLRCGKSTKPYGKVAQLVRACGSYPQCRGFKSLPCYQKKYAPESQDFGAFRMQSRSGGGASREARRARARFGRMPVPRIRPRQRLPGRDFRRFILCNGPPFYVCRGTEGHTRKGGYVSVTACIFWYRERDLNSQGCEPGGF